MATQEDVAKGVQHLLLDISGAKLTKGHQLVYNNIVWRKLQRAMEEAGFLDTVVTTEIAGIPAQTKSLEIAKTPGLPERTIRVHRMEEREASTTVAWALMSYCKYNMPVLAPAPTRNVWTWEDNQIKLNASTVANDFRVRHTQHLEDLAEGAKIPLTEVQDALIFGTAALIARSRGSRDAAFDYNAQYENEAKKILGRDALSEFAKLLEFEQEEDSA